MDFQELKETILMKDFYKRLLILLMGCFLLALTYNLFLFPNQIVVGGLTGLSIIVEEMFSLNHQIFLYGGTICLLVLSIIFLGVRETLISFFGSILYPICVSITEPLADILIPYVESESIIIVILLAGALYGIATGLIFKVGFDTGGTDIIIKIVNNYIKTSRGKIVFIVQSFIIISGGIIFGIHNMVYALFILVLYTTVMDKILIGISDSKLFFIHTKEIDQVKEFIIKDLETGVTILESEGGYSKEKSDILMCVVPNRDYYLFKEAILRIDSSAFFIINDCYEVTGGKKRSSLMDKINKKSKKV